MPLGFSEVVERRRSVRSYTGDAASLGDLSAILAAASGVTTHQLVELHGSGSLTLWHRSVASAGRLYPVDVVLASLSIMELPSGIYRYDPTGHRLLPMFAADRVQTLLRLLLRPGRCYLDPTLLWCDSPHREILADDAQVRRSRNALRIYGGGSHRAQRGACGDRPWLRHVECASVYDDEVHEVLDLDGSDMALLHAIIIGCPP